MKKNKIKNKSSTLLKFHFIITSLKKDYSNPDGRHDNASSLGHSTSVD